MKTLKTLSLVFVFMSHLICANAYAETPATPIAAVQKTVDSFIDIISNNKLDKETKKSAFSATIDEGMDLTASAQRVLATQWKKSADQDRKEFTLLFKQVLINTYYGLLSKYTDEKVIYINELIKKERYATVNTNIIIKGNAIPVQYKLIKRKDAWRIYDVSAEGISMVKTFNKDYKTILRTKGLAYLNTALQKKYSKPTL